MVPPERLFSFSTALVEERGGRWAVGKIASETAGLHLFESKGECARRLAVPNSGRRDKEGSRAGRAVVVDVGDGDRCETECVEGSLEISEYYNMEKGAYSPGQPWNHHSSILRSLARPRRT